MVPLSPFFACKEFEPVPDPGKIMCLPPTKTARREATLNISSWLSWVMGCPSSMRFVASAKFRLISLICAMVLGREEEEEQEEEEDEEEENEEEEPADAATGPWSSAPPTSVTLLYQRSPTSTFSAGVTAAESM